MSSSSDSSEKPWNYRNGRKPQIGGTTTPRLRTVAHQNGSMSPQRKAALELPKIKIPGTDDDQ